MNIKQGTVPCFTIAAFSSIGGFLANIFDAMDGHWDGYLSIRYSKKKGVVHI